MGLLNQEFIKKEQITDLFMEAMMNYDRWQMILNAIKSEIIPIKKNKKNKKKIKITPKHLKI